MSARNADAQSVKGVNQVKATTKPTVTVQILSNPAVNIGNRQLVCIRATGWGRLSIRTSRMQHSEFFFEDSEWKFILPKDLSTEVTVANLFGRSTTMLAEKLNKIFLSEEEFFEKLKPVLKKIDKPCIKALPRTAFDTVRFRIDGQFKRSHQIPKHRIRVSDIIYLPNVKFLTHLKFFNIPTASIQNRIKPSYRNIVPALIKKDALDIINVIKTIKKEIEHEHR